MTLDSADNDASRFLSCLSAAVAALSEEEPEPASGMAAGSVAPGDLALNIMARLAERTAPFALFLDDVESVHEPAVWNLMRELLDHLPRRGQLIIGSRGIPELGLGRLRARGQLLEIDAAQLRFSVDETAAFLTQHRKIALQDKDVSKLHRKTEGWVAALWLASIALERREARSEFIERFSGSEREVADYLAEDVLANQPPHIRDFLLRTSVLRHLNASLCDALLPGADSGAILRQLEEANLFLTPIEGEERTYRYHSLFAGFLRARLARERPAEIVRLHRAASSWYEERGRPVPAIDHALESGNYEHAVTLLTQHAEALLEEGRMRLLNRWFGALPEDYTRTSELMQVVRVWAVCMTRGPWEAMELLQKSSCLQTTDPRVLAYLLAVRPMILAIMDRNEEACSIGREALTRIPAGYAFANSVLSNEMAYIFAVMGEYHESHKQLEAARQRRGGAGNVFNKMYSESVGGLIDLEEGHLQQAVARLRIAVNSTHATSYRYTGGNAWAGVLYAAALYEMNDLDQAEHLMHVYVPLAKDIGLPDLMIIGYTVLSRIAFLRGDIDQVFHNLTELEYLGHQRQLPRVVSSAKLERARVLVMQGNLEGARDELSRADNAEVWQRVGKLRLPAHDVEYYALAEIRWLVFSGSEVDVRTALLRLEGEIAQAVGSRRYRRALKLRLLQGLAYKGAGRDDEALTAITEVLRITGPENFVRLVADEGVRAGRLVRLAAQSLRPADGGYADPLFGAFLDRLEQAFGPIPLDDDEVRAADGSKTLVEPLTSKEIRILSLLAEGYSNSALAEKVCSSESTVRTHLRNINGKLSAQNRTQAVAIARRLGIIR